MDRQVAQLSIPFQNIISHSETPLFSYLNKTKEMAGLCLEGKEKSSQKCILEDQSQYTMCNARIYYGNVTFYKTSISPVTN